MTTVFFSYSRDTLAAAIELKQLLIQRGISVWLDQDEVRPGDDWLNTVRQAIEASDVMVSFISRYTFESASFREYYATEIKASKRIIPLALDDFAAEHADNWLLEHAPRLESDGAAVIESTINGSHGTLIELCDLLMAVLIPAVDPAVGPVVGGVANAVSAPEAELDADEENATASRIAPDGWLYPSADSPIPPSQLVTPSQSRPILNPYPIKPPSTNSPVPQPVQQEQPALRSRPTTPRPPAPKPALGAPSAATTPGSAAGPSDNLAGRYRSGGVADSEIVSPNREESRHRSTDEPASDHASKKATAVKDAKEATATAFGSAGALAAVEDVYFTAFRPEMVPVAQWLTMLVYAHADSARAVINADAGIFSNQMGGKPKAVEGKAAAHLARGTELRIVPTCDGVQFNPESITFKWTEDWHRIEFRFQAQSALSATEDIARVAIYVGPLLVGQIKLALLFTAASAGPTPNILSAITGRGKTKSRGKMKPASAKMYEARQIFLSYSHADTNIVLACRDACKRLGFIPLIDVDTLRAGQHWSDELMKMIDRADIFQLFWSERAAQSPFVQQEWEYALRLIKDNAKAPDFIRPTYWEKPPAPIPEPLADIHFDYTPAVN